jgi:hypothetical protein
VPKRPLELPLRIFHPDHIRDRRTQKPRSAGAIRGRYPFWAKVASGWRSASSTIACLLRLLKKAGMQRRKIVASLSSHHIGRRILHGVSAQYETDPNRIQTRRRLNMEWIA